MPERDTLLIVPIGTFSDDQSNKMASGLRNVVPVVRVAGRIPLPAKAYYAPRRRYRADSLLRFLSAICPQHCSMLALTNEDISVTKGTATDFGIMGLGKEPGCVCVVSTHRLRMVPEHGQLLKVCLHELGHNSGLPHCARPGCLMRNARGGNPLDDEYGFCYSCRQYLQGMGWQLQGKNLFAR